MVFLGAFLKHPLFGFATFWATMVTFRISENYFSGVHGGHNKANAFRHCIWNILIAKQCALYSKNDKEILAWVKRITNLHEELNPNKPLPREMDLKNNELGRSYYLSLKTSKTNEIIKFIFLRLERAKKLNSVLAIQQSKELVYIND